MQRMTKQRKLILHSIQGRTDHPSADLIYQQVKEGLPRISLATVYRNLEVLTETGDITKLDYGSGQSRYDPRTDKHHHFRCSVCDKIEDVPFQIRVEPLDQSHPWVQERIVTEARVELIGTCPACNS